MVRKMTEGSPFKAIALFAIPMFIGTVFQQVYTMVDSVVVGNYVSANALGALGICGGIFSLITSLLTGLSSGSGVVLAQFFGARKDEDVRQTFISTCIVSVLAGILLTIVGMLLARPLLLLLNTPDQQLADATTYLTILCAGLLANCLYNGISAVLRSLGDSVTPLVVLIVASLLNVGLDLVFVIVVPWGVAGVAIATVLSQLLSAIACIIYTMVRLPQLRFKLTELRPKRDIVREILRIGIPSAVTMSGVSISVMFMQRAINSFGETVVTGYTVGNRAEQIGLCLSISIGLAVATFCGQNIGAKQFDRVKQGIRIGVIVTLIYNIVVAGVMLLFTPAIARLFTDDEAVLEVASGVMYVTLPFAPILGLIFVFREFLKSAGDVAPTVVMSITEIIGRSVLAFLFAALWGYTGIWWVTPVGWVASLIIGVVRYRSGIWRRKILE